MDSSDLESLISVVGRIIDFKNDFQGRKLVSNAVAGLSRLEIHERDGEVAKRTKDMHLRPPGDDHGVQIDHPVAWDGTGRAQYSLLCYKLQVRPDPLIIHQLGQSSMVIDVGPLVTSRRDAANVIAPQPTDQRGPAHEQLTSAGAAILEALRHNSLAKSIR